MLSTGAWTQEVGRTYRLGILTVSTESVEVTRDVTLADLLAKYGFVLGHNLILDRRSGSADVLPGLARELAASMPDAILAVSSTAIQAIQEATTALPIVMFGDDPVGQGFAASLARPGGNVTGVTMLAAELDGKRLQLLHEALPSARRMAILAPPQREKHRGDGADRPGARDRDSCVPREDRLLSGLRQYAQGRCSGSSDQHKPKILSGRNTTCRPCAGSRSTDHLRVGRNGADRLRHRLRSKLARDAPPRRGLPCTHTSRHSAQRFAYRGPGAFRVGN